MSTQPRHPRVAIVASSLRLAGAEKQTFYMARALHQAGIETRVFYLGAGGYYETVLRQAGVPVHPVCVSNGPWAIFARLMAGLWRVRPEIVLAAQFGDLLYGAAAGRCCRALTLGGVRSDGLYELKAHGRLSRWMACLAHGLVANSGRARQNLVSRGIRRQKIEVLPNAIDLEDFDEQSALTSGINLPSGRIIAAAVGSLHPCKCFDLFLDALALARRRQPALAGVVAGADCGARAALQERANALGLRAPDLIFLGECTRIPALLVRSGLLVLSSEYEGFPNAILEAMAARLPVVATPAGDADVIVQHGQTGYVVDPGDSAGMAEFMGRLAQSPAMRSSFGAAGRARVEQEYNYESLAGRLLSALRRFAVQRGRSSLVRGLDRYVPVNTTNVLAEAFCVNEPAV